MCQLVDCDFSFGAEFGEDCNQIPHVLISETDAPMCGMKGIPRIGFCGSLFPAMNQDLRTSGFFGFEEVAGECFV